MEASRKRIAVFGCGFTSLYRQSLCTALIEEARALDVELVFFNSMGKIGHENAQYADYEFDLIDYVDLSPYDGIIFDGEGYNAEGMADRVIRKLRGAACPVVSISSVVEGFLNVAFDEKGAIRKLTEHFLDHHGFTRIAFMSGHLTHPDARARLAEFRSVMKERGMPEDGAGMFEGDFWFRKGEEAAEYFLSLSPRPQAIVCANDYMAIALIKALSKRDVHVPGDIAISGFDGTPQGQRCLPHLTTVTRERHELAKKALCRILGKDSDLRICPQMIISQSCGCGRLDYQSEAENTNRVYEDNRELTHGIRNAGSAMLRFNKVDNYRDLRRVFLENGTHFGDYSAFFLMMHTDERGHISIDSDFSAPCGRFRPIIWIDKDHIYREGEEEFDRGYLIPRADSEEPRYYYIMSVHCAERSFGYAAIEMRGNTIFNDFYNLWLLDMAMTLEILMKNDRIHKLIGNLENLSIRDGMTGLLNRRGFDEQTREALSGMRKKSMVCTMVIDMDGLKHINDVYGHYEGDCAIKAAADAITRCCDGGEIAARAGGDEFYIFATYYSEEKTERFLQRMEESLKSCNRNLEKPYEISLSYGYHLQETDHTGRIEDFLKISDAKMYEQKLSKPGRRGR
ncbi:MAG: diguanylate cyclase [Lachnospiraceae bacterium]|nr:diguanylate cyclase [Lachnospiraceae bacterium]